MELVPRKKNSYKTFQVSNSECDVNLHNVVTREFRISTDFLKSEIIQRSASVQEITRINTTADKKINLKDIKYSLYISSVVLYLSFWFRLNSFFSLVVFLLESTKEQKKLTTLKKKANYKKACKFGFISSPATGQSHMRRPT